MSDAGIQRRIRLFTRDLESDTLLYRLSFVLYIRLCSWIRWPHGQR
jgi:hypothetical protein